MSQTQQMTMAGMGGPVGGVAPQQMNAPTPPNQTNLPNPAEYVKKLNTYIYDYLLRNGHYDAARALCSETAADHKPSLIKGSPDSRNQPNGMDDGDGKEGLKNRPNDLSLPDLPSNDSAFLQDWWCQFWDIFHGQRHRGRPNTIAYLSHQRQIKTARNNMPGMDPNMQNMRAYSMNMQQHLQPDLRKAAMQGKIPMSQAQLNQMRQASQMQGPPDMQRSTSQMEGPRSGSPGPGGDAPSPKRQRLDGSGNMQQQMAQARPGQPGNQVGPISNAPVISLDSAAANQTREILLQHNLNPDEIPPSTFQHLLTQPANVQHKTAGEHYRSLYSKSLSDSMQSNIQAVIDNASANVNKNMPPHPPGPMGPGAQGSPMSQPGLDGAEFYPNGNGMRLANAAQAAGNGQNGGNHALQDYQMQLMLLEQQNKKRLLMARQEQDSMSQPGMNGGFGPPGMSPSGGRPVPSPGPGDMQRGTPKMGTSPNNMQGRNSPMPQPMNANMGNWNPEMHARMMQMNAPQNGAMRAPSSHPANLEMFARNQAMMPNGAMGPGPQQPGGMPGQMPPNPGQPNSTPRPANQTMPPPPAPPAGNPTGAAQPNSPGQQPAPPTPSQQPKPKPGGKKDNKGGNKGGNKKNANTGATPATESEQPPTPTPATPITPIHANSFAPGQNKQMPNGQGPQPPQQQPPNQANNQQQPPPPQQQQQPPQQPNAVQAPGADMDSFAMDGFNDMPFAVGGDNNDLLDGFDFDSFLNNEDSSMAFDTEFAFGGSGIEAGDGMNQ